MGDNGCGALGGMLWFGGWLFTIGWADLVWWKAILGLFVWPYYMGVHVAALAP